MEPKFEPVFEEKSTFGIDVDSDLQFLLSSCDKVLIKYDKELVSNAFKYCVEKHSGVIRKSGLPYYTHPLNVTLILINEIPYCDAESIAACLLHDVIEDVEGVKKDTIDELFGAEVAEMVDAVTKIRHEKTFATNSKASTARKIFLALVKDIRVILIKLADRLHNIRTLHYLKPEKQVDIAKETLNFYTPIAHRLGLNKIKMELENLSFYYSDKEAYFSIQEALKSKRREFLSYINKFITLIDDTLNNLSIAHTVTVMHKHEYEIFDMMQEGKSLSDIDNFYSVVIILNTNDISECYKVHGILANAFTAVSFVDYISNAKIDWYKSLNSELIGPDGKKVEIVIRTTEMEKISDEGFASSTLLKEGRTRALEINDHDIELWGIWMQDIIETYPETAQQTIWNSIKVNLFDNELTVFTKDGTAYKLSKGATVLDFAFYVSKDVGLQCVSAKVNGVLRDISYELRTGDQIEIIKSPNAKPKDEWQKLVNTYKGVITLHEYFKAKNEEHNPQVKELENLDVVLHIIGQDKEGMLSKITSAIADNNMKKVNIETTGDLFEAKLTVTIKDLKELNSVFVSILQIDGIRKVERIS
jgi:RelA/SpoT family (p)ppGpp synthetase